MNAKARRGATIPKSTTPVSTTLQAFKFTTLPCSMEVVTVLHFSVLNSRQKDGPRPLPAGRPLGPMLFNVKRTEKVSGEDGARDCQFQCEKRSCGEYRCFHSKYLGSREKNERGRRRRRGEFVLETSSFHPAPQSRSHQ